MTVIPTFFPASAGDGPELEEASSWSELQQRYARYLVDESKLSASGASGIAFPKTTAEISAVLRARAARGQKTTVSAARTGVTAGAVPLPDSAILSVDRMTRIGAVERSGEGEAVIRVEAGVPLRTLQTHLSEEHPEWIFPVDPTETWAAIGGMTATNASGARSFGYGPMREWVVGFRAVLADGQVLELKRGDCPGSDGELVLRGAGDERRLVLSELAKPRTKNTIGYSLGAGVDLVDVLIGCEGTLCVFSDVLLRLCPAPAGILSYVQFFETDRQALDFVVALREWRERPLSIEYFDGGSLRLLRRNKNVERSPLLRIAGEGNVSAVYTELEYPDEDSLASISEKLADAAAAAGSDPERSFAGIEERDVRELKAFRHALPEEINATIARRKRDFPGLHKLATDMAVPDARLHDIFFEYQRTLDAQGLEYAIFGHAGNNHFHVNMLPRNEDELRIGKELYLEFAKLVVQWKGAVSAEHGLGRLKKHFLEVQYSPAEMRVLRSVKSFFDPNGLLNPGVLFD